MTRITEDYILALSAILESAYMVNKIAISSYNAEEDSQMLINSIYITDTNSASKIYGDNQKLLNGFELLKNILRGKNDISLINIQKYALSIILIQKNINKIIDLKKLIRKKIDNYQENSIMATNLGDLIAYSETIYTEHVGIIRPRIVISGKKEYLEKNSSLIRALLLSGVRASFLWSKHGGSKWQLMYKRNEILSKCDSLFIK